MTSPGKRAAKAAAKAKKNKLDKEETSKKASTSANDAASSRTKTLIADNKDVCPECNNHVKDDDKALECEDCIQWWHIQCIGINTEEYKFARKYLT